VLRHYIRHDLRTRINAIDEISELKLIEGADWDLEIGTIFNLNQERMGLPVLLLDKIKD
jgi:hypothetical protein